MRENFRNYFFWNTEGFPNEFFRYRETKNFKKKNIIAAPISYP